MQSMNVTHILSFKVEASESNTTTIIVTYHFFKPMLLNSKEIIYTTMCGWYKNHIEQYLLSQVCANIVYMKLLCKKYWTKFN